MMLKTMDDLLETFSENKALVEIVHDYRADIQDNLRLDPPEHQIRPRRHQQQQYHSIVMISSAATSRERSTDLLGELQRL